MGGHLCNDWRITNQMNYLFRARLIKTTFSESSHSDHEHCEFCFAKFGNAEGLLQSGYCTLDKYHWVCSSHFCDVSIIPVDSKLVNAKYPRGKHLSFLGKTASMDYPQGRHS